MNIPAIPISGTTKLTALLGSPVSHSISPLMHNRAFQYLGLDYAYLCFDVTEKTLPEAVEQKQNHGTGRPHLSCFPNL